MGDDLDLEITTPLLTWRQLGAMLPGSPGIEARPRDPDQFSESCDAMVGALCGDELKLAHVTPTTARSRGGQLRRDSSSRNQISLMVG